MFQFCGFFKDQLEKARGADVTGRAQLDHRLHLLLGLTGTAREDSATERMRATLHHRAGRHKVITEAVVRQFARTKAGRVQRTRHAPVVAARALGLVQGAGAAKNARHGGAIADGGKTAKGVIRESGPLAFVQFVLARHWQAGKGGAAGDAGGVCVCQDSGKRRCVAACMRYLRRQCRQQGGFTLQRGAGFEGVVEAGHGIPLAK